MAQQEELVLWIDLRWKNAIEKHLNGETLQEHLENVLGELCNQLPEREYERISHEIQSEAAARRVAEEADSLSQPDRNAPLCCAFHAPPSPHQEPARYPAHQVRPAQQPDPSAGEVSGRPRCQLRFRRDGHGYGHQD